MPARGAWNLTALTATNSAGLSIAGGALSATSPGTAGRVICPLFDRRGGRVTATIKVSKATSGSSSFVGFAASALGVLPDAASEWYGIGYLQGTGIISRRGDFPGSFDQLLVADAALTDGQLIKVSLIADGVLTPGASSEISFQFSIIAADDTLAGTQFVTTSQQVQYLPNFAGVIAITTVASGVANLSVSDFGGKNLGINSGSYFHYLSSHSTLGMDSWGCLLPKTPNGKLVIALHGHGGAHAALLTSSQFSTTWDALLAEGYTIVANDMGGDKWGYPPVQAQLADFRDMICAMFGLDTKVLLWGYSMGGGAALTAIGTAALGANNVSAAYLAAPACDIQAVYAANSGSFTEIPGLYPSQAAYNASSPILLPTTNYAGVPLLMVASPSDAVVAKSANTDAMAARLASVTTVVVAPATGAHDDVSMFRPELVTAFFNRHRA